jgi:outer membrane lipoprotein-sorting protein
MMRNQVLALLVMTVGCVSAAPSATPASESQADQVLQQLDDIGQRLKEFSAKVRLNETDNLGGSVIHTGNVYFQHRADGSARIHVIFDKRQSNNRITDEKTEYLLDGPVLTDRNYRSRNGTIRDVALKPGQKMNLFKLGEGPFPLPIGQSPADVHRESDVQFVAPAKDDPKNTAHIRLTPKKESDLGRRFKTVDVWVDQTSHMPVRVDTADTKETQWASTELTDIVLNPPGGLKEADFQLPPIDKTKWSSHVEQLKFR